MRREGPIQRTISISDRWRTTNFVEASSSFFRANCITIQLSEIKIRTSTSPITRERQDFLGHFRAVVYSAQQLSSYSNGSSAGA